MATGFTEIWNDMTNLVRRIKAVEAMAGKPRPLADGETPSTWREIKIGSETFRVLTLEDTK